MGIMLVSFEQLDAEHTGRLVQPDNPGSNFDVRSQNTTRGSSNKIAFCPMTSMGVTILTSMNRNGFSAGQSLRDFPTTDSHQPSGDP
jgi:hypothetical protein